ncbi:MAG: alpha/beta fold hydrolase [Candidatus Dormibacteraceae bacterium]
MLVAFLHGLGQRGRSWDEVIGLLPAGWRCLAPDLRGTTMAGCQAELESLWGSEAVHLVAYSMGGRLALHIAAWAPSRLLSLTTIGAHAGLPGPERERRLRSDQALADDVERGGAALFADRFGSLPLFESERRRGPEFGAARRRERLEQDPAHLAACLRGMGAGAMEPVWDQLAGFTAPALFVAGVRDARYAAHARRLATTVQDGRAEIVPGAGHAVHLERPGLFAAILRRHLDQVSRR